MSENNDEKMDVTGEEKKSIEAVEVKRGDEESPKKFSWKREVMEWLQAIAIAVIVGLLLNHFVFNIVQVQGTSMVPTLQNADRLVVISRYITKIENGDIIVFRPVHDQNRPYIKRVIAVAGQTVDMDKNSRVIVDGKMLDEGYVSQYLSTHGDMQFPLTVPEGSVFVMGDNRPNSKDSRFSEVGLVNLDTVIGKATLRWFPFNQFATFKHVTY